MSAHHHAADCSQVFDADDTSETHVPDAEQREALELLGYAAIGRVRVTVRQWKQVLRVASAIKDARNATRRPLSASEGEDGYLGGSGSSGTVERRTA